MRRAATAVAVIAVIVGAVTGCSTAPPGAENVLSAAGASASASAAPAALATTPSKITLRDGTRVLTAGQPPEAIGDVLYSGQIVTLDGGCWGFALYDRTSVLLLPQGTVVADDGASAFTPAGETLRVGDEVSGGGYGAGAGDVRDREWRRLVPECFQGGAGFALADVIWLNGVRVD